MTNEPFFMLYIEGGRILPYRHYIIQGAEHEAKRLLKQYGKKVFVLCLLKSFEVNEFEIKLQIASDYGEDRGPDID